MFRTIIFLSALACITRALEESHNAKILDYQLEHTPHGHYFYRFESSDGIVREEEGNLLDETVPDSPVIVKGSYSYTDETGKVYTVRYIADENGFHPEGDHIKVPNYVVNPVNLVLPTTPRPLQFVQTARPQFLPALSTTPRPEISTTPTRIQIPVESQTSSRVTSKPLAFSDLDSKLQNSIVNLLTNGETRGFNIGAVNNL